jgi:hypothetical protein
MSSTNTTTPRVKLDVEAFVATDENGSSVHIRTDSDLGIKFKRGEIAPSDTGRINVAMVLSVDDENIDLILFDSGESAKEVLGQIREAAEQALEGLKGAPLASRI